MSDKDWKLLEGAEDLYKEAKCFECVVMEFQLPEVFNKVEAALLATKKPCKHLKTLYHRIESIMMKYGDML